MDDGIHTIHGLRPDGTLPPAARAEVEKIAKTAGAHAGLTADDLARSLGFWAVTSDTEPPEPIKTLDDGTTVPVVWHRPAVAKVPVVPEVPFFDKFGHSITAPALVGIEYVLTHAEKDGTTITLGHIIPAGGHLDLKGVDGIPAAPYSLTVQARARPGYELYAGASWTWDVIPPDQRVLVTSDGFTGREVGALLRDSTTDAALGGEPMTWSQGWRDGTGRHGLTIGEGGVLRMSTLVREAAHVPHIGTSVAIEFDLELPSRDVVKLDYGPMFGLGLNGVFGQGATIQIGFDYERKLEIRVNRSAVTNRRFYAEWNGHYRFELGVNSLEIMAPGLAPFTVPIVRPISDAHSGVTVESNANAGVPDDAYVHVRNLRLHRIGAK